MILRWLDGEHTSGAEAQVHFARSMPGLKPRPVSKLTCDGAAEAAPFQNKSRSFASRRMTNSVDGCTCLDFVLYVVAQVEDGFGAVGS